MLKQPNLHAPTTYLPLSEINIHYVIYYHQGLCILYLFETSFFSILLLYLPSSVFSSIDDEFWMIVFSVKGCVRYIFASLFCMSKREHLWNKEKCFLLHFKSSSRLLDNQLSTFWIFKCHDVIKCPSMKHETRNTYYWITWEENAVW